MNADELTAAYTRTPADERAVAEGYVVDLAKAQRFATFCRRFIRHSKGRWAGKPFELLDWQWAEFALPVFGWVHAETGLRRFRQVFLEVPKKNGKTTLCSAVGGYLLVGDHEPGAEVYIAAYGRDQAKIAFREIQHAVRKSPALSSRLRCYRAAHRIVDESSASFLQAISAEAGLQEGLNVHGLIFDEVHAQRNRDLWDVLEGGGAARTQPLIVGITTAGDERSVLCRELHDYARSIETGDNDDPTFYGLIFGADVEDPWDDVETWHKANPSLGETLTVDYLEGLAAKARVSRPAKDNFLRRHLNVWTRSASRWLDLEAWDRCSDAEYLDQIEESCPPGPAGLDLAATVDLVGYVRVFDCPDGRVGVRCRAWTTDRARDVREEENRHRYGAWIDSGFLEVAGAQVVDVSKIRQAVVDDFEAGRLSEVGVDPWGSGMFLARDLDEDDGIPAAMVRQGYQTMSAPTKRLEELILSRGLVHDGHPVLRWCVGNVVAAQDPAGNIKPDRRRSPEKIDLAVALVIGLARWMAGPEERASIYRSRGLRVFG